MGRVRPLCAAIPPTGVCGLSGRDVRADEGWAGSKKRPGKPGRLYRRKTGWIRSAGLQGQAIGRQDRLERLEEALAATAAALAAAAAARQHALALADAGDERAARVAAFGAGAGAGQVEDRLAAAVV